MLRHIARHLFTILAALSLILWLWLAVHWYNEHIAADDITERVIARVIWKPFLATMILPVAWWATVYSSFARRRRRKRAGQCLMCGYDLRESPERCPECGNVSA